MADSIHVRGEGGMVIEMDLPLPDHIEQRLAQGHLQRVNGDGAPYSGANPEAAPEPPTAPPAKSAQKGDWVAWAVVCGATPDEAEGMTRADLIEKYQAPTSA